MEHIWRMQEFCNSMAKLSPDSYEYAYLKAIVLFSPGVWKRFYYHLMWIMLFLFVCLSQKIFNEELDKFEWNVLKIL